MIAPTPEPAPTWQLVLVAWGDKYPVAEINYLIETVVTRASRRPRVVLISDRERPGIAADVVVPFPEFFNVPRFRTGGCHAKLAMFEEGVVPGDLPAIYIDIDTVVFGDLAEFLKLLDTPRTIAIFQSAALPFGALARAIYRLTGGRSYARGNSSIVVYHPAHCRYVAASFREHDARYPDFGFRPMMADERFLSWVAQPHMRAVPSSLAVKFPTEYMMYWTWLIYARAFNPFTRARRSRLRAVTLPGLSVKWQTLLELPDGAVVTDNKGRKMIWDDRTLGDMRRKLIEHYRGLVARGVR